MGKVDESIIGKLFWERCTEVEKHKRYNMLREQYREKAKAYVDNENLIKCFKSATNDKEKQDELEQILVDYTNHLLYEKSFESLYFYELGFKDGYELSGEINDK